MSKKPWENASGCNDPTAYKALKNIEVEKKRLDKLVEHIYYVCNLAGFDIEERIVLKNRESGRVWK